MWSYAVKRFFFHVRFIDCVSFYFKQIPRVHCIEFDFDKLKKKLGLDIGRINYTGKERIIKDIDLYTIRLLLTKLL